MCMQGQFLVIFQSQKYNYNKETANMCCFNIRQVCMRMRICDGLMLTLKVTNKTSVGSQSY